MDTNNNQNINNEYMEANIKKSQNKNESYYDGKVIELIGYNLLRIIITILTIGFAKPWADCMLYNYKINHTIINGQRLKFAGSGSNLFVQKFKWAFFSIITLGIYAFVVPLKKIEWIISNMHFEDKEYIKGESVFTGKLISLIGINFLCLFLNLVSLGLAKAYTNVIKAKWIAKNSIISKRIIVFNGSAFNLFVNYIIWYLLTFITFGVFLLWLDIKKINWFAKNSHIKLASEVEKKEKIDPYLIIMIICFTVVTWLVSYIIIDTILFKEPKNIEADILEIEKSIAPGFEEIRKRYESIKIDNNYISNLDSLKDFSDKGAKGTYWYEMQSDLVIVIKPIYKRYLCSQSADFEKIYKINCTYLNLPNILENPDLISEYLEARINNFNW